MIQESGLSFWMRQPERRAFTEKDEHKHVMRKEKAIIKHKICILLGLGLLVSGCTSTMKTRGPIWYVPAVDTRVVGIGANVLTVPSSTNSIVIGIRFELVGLGLLIPFVPEVVSPSTETRGRYLSQLSASGENVYGLELSGAGTRIKGHVAGISLCLIGGVKNRVTGIVGVLGYNAVRDLTGLQFGAFNSTYRAVGMQAGFENRASELEGLQIGAFNGSRGGAGLQLGVFNATSRAAGVQVGLDNRALKLEGLQIGVFNGCANGRGIQIGLWNTNDRRSLPIINWTWNRVPLLP